MIRTYESTAEGWRAAERFADEWAGDNQSLALIVERFDSTDTLDLDAVGVELFVIGGEKAVHYELGHTLRSAAGYLLNVNDGHLETQYRVDRRNDD